MNLTLLTLKSATQTAAAGADLERKINPRNKDLAAYGIPGITGLPPGCTHLPSEYLL
jgi:hypothetical protein